jgi:uncharacterized protein YndB with AHSA1/START domain
VPASPETVWDVVSDPERLPEWWPGVSRVEEATALAWTTVLVSPRGKNVRADYTRVRAEAPRHLVWRHEAASAGGTQVSLTARQRSRGFARFGAFQLRRAAGRRLDEALDSLEAGLSGERG